MVVARYRAAVRSPRSWVAGARAAAVAGVLALASGARADSLHEQVNRAIERGIERTRTYLDDKGAGNTRYHASYPAGDTALVLYTLVKSGVSADDPQVRKCLEWLRYQDWKQTYSAAVFVLALDSFQDRGFDGPILAAAKWLEEGLRRESTSGLFSYPGTHVDLSNTQYGVLGLWAAERHGYEAAPDTWAMLLAGVVANQRPSGGFAYRRDDHETGSMTVGALTALHLALERVPAQQKHAEARRKAKAALERGWAYLERGFRVDADLHGPHGSRSGWRYYYLYGVERLAAIAGRDRIGTHDWYAEGARHLVADQRDDGSWGDPWDTCFALLFLRRATFTTMGGERARVEGDGVAKRLAGPVRPGRSVRWMRHWLVLGPLADPEDTLFDDPPFDMRSLAPSPSSTTGKWRWIPTSALGNWVAIGPKDAPMERSVGWAITYLHVQDDLDAVLWFGNDNGVRVLLDGSEVYAAHSHERHDADAHAEPVRLTKGTHRLLVQLENWDGATNFCMRYARPDGSACDGVRPSLRADATDLAESARAQPGLFSLPELLALLPRDRRLALTFDVPDQLDRIALDGDAGGLYPCWRGEPGAAATRPPNPGAFGFLGLCGEEGDWIPSRAYWKVRVPEKPSVVRVRASSVPAVAPGRADTVLRVRAFDGELRTLLGEVVGPDAAPAASNWRWFEGDLTPYAGRDVLVIVETHAGGREWYYEDLWIDAIEIRPAD